MLLDHRFERLLRDRIGPDQYASLKPKSKEAARTYWQDRVKPNYVGKYDEDYGEIDYFIPLPGASDDPTVPIEDGFFHLSRLQSSEIREDQPIKMDFYRTIEVRNAKTDMSGTVTLYFYNDGNPPDVRNSSKFETLG
ncbi:hypothetical protein ACP6JC_004036 [Aspergillus fumigatus]